MDLYGILVGSIFYKMAGLLLPIIYMIMTSNALIAGQVDSGSMAYVLSTSTKRRTVTFTQALYLAGSLLLMFACTTVTSIICLNTVNVKTDVPRMKEFISVRGLPSSHITTSSLAWRFLYPPPGMIMYL